MQDIVLRTGRRFYLYLAIFLSVVAVIDLTASQLIKGIYNSTYDWLMQNRLGAPLPDKEIVIIDIDEASLRELSGTLGRWPWPRRVMGEMVEALETQGAKAIVLDILFGSPDLADPKSDQYLARVYRMVNRRFHLDEWDASILRKLQTLESIYEKISVQASNHRMEMLEWVIIFLIAFSIALEFIRH